MSDLRRILPKSATGTPKLGRFSGPPPPSGRNFLQYIKASIYSIKSVLHWSSKRKQQNQHWKETFIQRIIVLACRLL